MILSVISAAAGNIPCPQTQKKRIETGVAESREQNVGVRRNSSALTPSDKSSKEAHLGKPIKNFFIKLYNERHIWFPVEPKEGRKETKHARLPVGAMSGIAVFALSLGLIVGSYAMIGSATSQVSKIENQIAVLETEHRHLEGKLDMKYSISEVQKDAEALGMIKSEYAENVYLQSDNEEIIEVYDNEEKAFSFAALLNALGFKTK